MCLEMVEYELEIFTMKIIPVLHPKVIQPAEKKLPRDQISVCPTESTHSSKLPFATCLGWNLEQRTVTFWNLEQFWKKVKTKSVSFKSLGTGAGRSWNWLITTSWPYEHGDGVFAKRAVFLKGIIKVTPSVLPGRLVVCLKPENPFNIKYYLMWMWKA